MPFYRKRQNQKNYDSHTSKAKASKICTFCKLSEGDNQVIKVTPNFKIIRNIFPYDNWDGLHVLDHIMVVPISHTESLSKLGDKAAIEYVGLVSSYELEGYDVYARSPHSIIKSIAHQHTHLIKTEGERYKGGLHLMKPYININF